MHDIVSEIVEVQNDAPAGERGPRADLELQQAMHLGFHHVEDAPSFETATPLALCTSLAFCEIVPSAAR